MGGGLHPNFKRDHPIACCVICWVVDLAVVAGQIMLFYWLLKWGGVFK